MSEDLAQARLPSQPETQTPTRRQAMQQAQRVRLLLSLLGRQSSGRTATSARQQAWLVIFSAGFLYLVFFIMAVSSLASAWHGGDWGTFWGHMAEVLFAGHFVLGGNALGMLGSLREGAKTLRDAVTAGDDALAPPAAVQPGPLTGSELVTGPLRVGPLQRYGTEVVSRQRIAVFVILALFGTMMTAFLLELLMSGGSRRSQGIAWAFIASFTVPMLLVFGMVVALMMRQLRGYYVLVDDYGIRREKGRWQSIMPWSDVRAFFCVTYQLNPRRSPVTEYLLDTGKTLMRWRGPDPDAGLSATAPAAYAVPDGRTGFAAPMVPHASAGWSAREASLDVFARLIVARAHVPLRDITPALQRIAAATPAQPKRGLFGALFTMKQASQMAAATRASAPGAYAPATFAPVSFGDAAQPAQKPRRRWLPESRLLRVALVVQLALAILLAATGFALQRYQPGYYRDLLTAVRAQQPLYRTTLAANDGLWPEHGPTANDSATYAFTDGAYQLQGTREGWTVDASPTVVYHGPLAVEATVQQMGQATYSGGVGLLLYYVSQPESYVVFLVQPEGTWKLYWYTDPGDSGLSGWTTLASGTSNAIARGLGVANTVLVINWGARYVLYVDDTWVYDFNGNNPALPAAGQMGVFVNDGPSGGTFTSFALYPAPRQPLALPLP